MGNITNAVNAAFRDYETENVPASGPNRPAKAEIRAIGPVVEAELASIQSDVDDIAASQSGGFVGYDTQAHLFADLSHPAAALAEVFSDPDPTKNGVYIKVGASGAGGWSLQAAVESRHQITSRLDQLAPSIAVQDSERPVERIAFQIGALNMFAPSHTAPGVALGVGVPVSFGANVFMQAVDFARPVFISAALIPIQLQVTTPGFAFLSLKVWRRLKSSPSNSGGGVAGGDQLVFSGVQAPTGIGPSSAALQMARAEIGIDCDPLYTYIFAWAALDSFSAVMTLGAAFGAQYETSLPSYSPGWYGFGGFNNAYTQNTADHPFALTLLETLPEKRPVIGGANSEIAFAAADPSLLRSPHSWSRTLNPGALIQRGPFQIRQDHAVTIPATEIIRDAGPFLIPEQTITLTDLSVDTVTAEAVTLSYQGVAYFSHRYVTDVVVKKHSNGAALVEGTDYILGWEAGVIVGLQNVAPFQVDIDFHGTLQRYDLIYFNPATGNVGKVDGTARLIDPEEYRPACPAGMVPLYVVYFFRYSAFDVVEVIPIHQWNGYVRIGHEAEHQRWLEWNRGCLPKTMKKARRGDAVTVVTYGDSNGNMGSSNTQYTRQTTNDVLGFLTSQRVPADTAALYNSLQFIEDGVSKVPINFPFFVKAALEGIGGSKVSLQNFSIAGTAAVGVGAFDGAEPLRMAGVIAAKPDLVLVALGTNGVTSAAMTTILTTFLAAGIEVMVIGPPRFNLYWGTFTQGVASFDDWARTNAMLVRLARQNRCAYVNPENIFAVGNEGACGLSQRSMGGASTGNHYGIAERRHLGEYAALTFYGKPGAVPTGPAIGHVSVQVPVTGFSITIGADTRVLVLKPAATLAAGTVTLPAAPIDEAIVRISSTQTITVLTVSANAGQAVFNPPTTLAAGGGVSFVWDAATATWYRLQ